jgi:hypothetical protein
LFANRKNPKIVEVVARDVPEVTVCKGNGPQVLKNKRENILIFIGNRCALIRLIRTTTNFQNGPREARWDSGNGIVASGAPGVTAAQAFDDKDRGAE